MTIEPHHSITDAAADALHERVRQLESNRWAAFTDDELAILEAVLPSAIPFVRPPMAPAAVMADQVELERRARAAQRTEPA